MNLAQRLIEMDQGSPKRILVVGDPMIDVYVLGHLEHTCQEGCQKFIEEKRLPLDGGAANAANSIRHWWSGAELPYVGLHFRPESIPTKTRYMVGNTCVFRHDNDAMKHCPNLPHLHHTLVQGAREYSAVLISDYDKGTLAPEFIKKMADMCSRLSIPCVADCKREPEVYAGCIRKCNLDWSIKYGKVDGSTHDVTTDGEHPPVVRGKSVLTNLPEVHCVNHVGAGDCFAAHLALALAHGFSLKDAAAVAHSAGRVYVQYAHNRPPRPEEIAADMEAIPAAVAEWVG